MAGYQPHLLEIGLTKSRHLITSRSSHQIACLVCVDNGFLYLRVVFILWEGKVFWRSSSQHKKSLSLRTTINDTVVSKYFGKALLEKHDPDLCLIWMAVSCIVRSGSIPIICFDVLPLSINKQLCHVVVGRVNFKQKLFSQNLRVIIGDCSNWAHIVAVSHSTLNNIICLDQARKVFSVSVSITRFGRLSKQRIFAIVTLDSHWPKNISNSLVGITGIYFGIFLVNKPWVINQKLLKLFEIHQILLFWHSESVKLAGFLATNWLNWLCRFLYGLYRLHRLTRFRHRSVRLIWLDRLNWLNWEIWLDWFYGLIHFWIIERFGFAWYGFQGDQGPNFSRHTWPSLHINTSLPIVVCICIISVKKLTCINLNISIGLLCKLYLDLLGYTSSHNTNKLLSFKFLFIGVVLIIVALIIVIALILLIFSLISLIFIFIIKVFKVIVESLFFIFSSSTSLMYLNSRLFLLYYVYRMTQNFWSNWFYRFHFI